MISWTYRVKNKEVLRSEGAERNLMKDIKRRQIKCLKHLLRVGGLERDCLLGQVSSMKTRGRQRINFMDSLMEGIVWLRR